MQRSASEPQWNPEPYVFYRDSQGSGFINVEGMTLTCDDLGLHEMSLIPTDAITAAQDKFNRCSQWR